MKKFAFIFAAIACIGIVAGCNKEKEEPTLSVAPTSITAKAEATTSSVKVSSNSGWTVKSSESWVTVSPVQGNGDATVSVTVAENTVASAREATLTFSCGTKSATVKVSQEAAVISGPYLAVTPSALTSTAAEAQLALAVTANTAWTAAGPDWVTLTPARGDGDASITVALAANTGEARSGEIVFTYDTDKTAKVSVSQEAAAATPAGDWAGEWILTGHDETDNVDVAAKYYGSGSGTADNNLKYMVITRNADNKIVPKNETDEIGDCRLTIAKIDAQSDTTFWSIRDSKGLYLESDGDGVTSQNYLRGHDTLSENGWWTINDTEEGTVLVATRAKSRGNNRNVIRLNHNSSSYIFSSYAGTQQPVKLISWNDVYEAAIFSAELTSGASVNATGGESVITVGGNVDWTATVTGGATLNPASGKGAGEIKVTIPANTAATAAEYTVTVSTTAEVATKSYEFKISQDAAGTTKMMAITSAEDFATFATRISDYTASETVTLEADITVTEPVSALGCNFDGKGHTITYSFTQTENTPLEVGLFRTMDNVKISNLKVAGSLTVNTTSGTFEIGSIVGKAANGGSIEDCESSVTVLSQKKVTHHMGGIVGYIAGTTLKNCTNKGDVGVIMDGTCNASQIGGMVGHIELNGTLEGCVNEGKISYDLNDKAGSARMGGMAGYLVTPSNIVFRNCVNKGELYNYGYKKDAWSYVGGISGYSSNATGMPTGTLVYENCSNSGKIVSKGTLSTGGTRTAGLISHCGKFTEITVTNCSNTGVVESDFPYANNQAGGVIAFGEADSKITCSGCSNNAEIKSNAVSGLVGGIIGGTNSAASTFTDFVVGASSSASIGSGSIGAAIGKATSLTTALTGKVAGVTLTVGETATTLTSANYLEYVVGSAMAEGGSVSGVTFGE